jgi:hypothetical protein
MLLVFVAEPYYPYGGAADFAGTLNDLTPESVTAFLMQFMADLAQSYKYVSDPRLACQHAYDSFTGMITVVDTNTLKRYGAQIKLEYGGRSLTVIGQVESYGFGYDSKMRKLPLLSILESNYQPSSEEEIDDETLDV